MKLKESKRMLLVSKVNLALSIFLLVFASFVAIQNISEGKPYYARNAFFGIILGLTLLICSYTNIKRFKAESEGKIITDERSRRVGEKAGLFAFLLLLGSIMVSAMANSILNLRLEYTSTVYVILISSLFSWIIIGYYLDKKGEV